MSKKRKEIITKALELFNKEGIEYVGVRELAKTMGLKGGNITYYFSTKNDLIVELTNMLNESNTKVFESLECVSLYDFLELHKQLYFNQYKFRCIFLSLPLLLKQNNVVYNNYNKRQVFRRNDVSGRLKLLFQNGYLKETNVDEIDILLNAIVMHNRFWITEANIDAKDAKEKDILKHYLKRLAGLLSLIASPKGKDDIDVFLSELI